MTTRSRGALRAFLCVAVAGLGHRLLLFLLHREDLRAFSEANAGWYTMQQLPIEMLRDHLLISILALQQTPPVSNVVMGIAAKSFAWPAGVTGALVLFGGLLSVATALIVVRILLDLYPGRVWLAAAVGIVFAINTDLVVLEYNSLGQIFYEHVSMLLAAALAWALLALRQRRDARFSAAAGLFVALLALSRATWSYFAAPALLLVLWLCGGRRPRHALAFLVPVLVLQGGWMAKNWYVYGYLSPSTSTWAGWNFARGIGGTGFLRSYRAFIAARRAPEDGGLRCDFAEMRQPEIAPEIQEQDARVERWLGIENPPLNTLVSRALWRDCERAFFAFARHAPEVLLAKTWASYRVFWLPPASYGFVALFATSHRLDRGLSPARTIELLVEGKLPEDHRIASGAYRKIRYAPVRLYTLRWLDPFLEITRQLGVHLFLPLACLAWFTVRRARGPDAEPRAVAFAALVVFATLYSYVALVSSAGEHGENMRYRIGVEPMIWLITVVAVLELGSLGRTWLRPAARNGG